MKQSAYADMRNQNKPDPERQRQPRLDWYMERYGTWRSLYEGTALEEKISVLTNLASNTDQQEFRYPVRFNLIRSYCLLYAGLLWGRGTTGKDVGTLFEIRVDSKVPGKAGPEGVKQAKQLEDILSYWWAHWFQVLRPNGTIQQWAGGCVLKVCWHPRSPTSVYGLQLQTVQPEHFYPVWNPLNFEELIAVKIKFEVSRAIAKHQFGLKDSELDEYATGDSISVEEHWDRYNYEVALGKGRKRPDDPGVIAREVDRDGNETRLQGKNEYIHPKTGLGVIPFVYVPRLRDGQFFGDSLAYSLEGIQRELNKTLADYGDALTRGAHPPFGISDYHGPSGKDKEKQGVILIPKHGALNMGMTPAGRTPSKVHEFPPPDVPPETGNFTDRLLTLSEVASGLTPAARGAVSASKSGVAMAMELLPTTNAVGWERSHWTSAVAGLQGINEIAEVIWLNKGKGISNLPSISPGMLDHLQYLDYRPVVPRDHTEIIDEVVRLATAKAVSPQEWLRRLGDVPDLDEEFVNLVSWLVFTMKAEAAVAGRAIQVTQTTNPENPAAALPEIAGQTEQPKAKQPATQPEGQKSPKE